MFKFSSITFLIIVLVSVLLLSLCGSCSEGLEKSSSILNMQLRSINILLADYKTIPFPDKYPSGTKEFIDKNIVYIDTFAKRLTELVSELSTTMDTTVVRTAKIDVLIRKYKQPAVTNMTLDTLIPIYISLDLGFIKQLASEVPKTIFDKYINYRIEFMNGLFSSSNIDEIFNLASKIPSIIIVDKIQLKSKIFQYLDDFKRLKNKRWLTRSSIYAERSVRRKQRLEDIPILPQTNDNSSSWFKL
jgi:hypothetical protein